MLSLTANTTATMRMTKRAPNIQPSTIPRIFLLSSMFSSTVKIQNLYEINSS